MHTVLYKTDYECGTQVEWHLFKKDYSKHEAKIQIGITCKKFVIEFDTALM